MRPCCVPAVCGALSGSTLAPAPRNDGEGRSHFLMSDPSVRSDRSDPSDYEYDYEYELEYEHEHEWSGGGYNSSLNPEP